MVWDATKQVAPTLNITARVLYQLITWVSVQGIHVRKFIMQSYPITATFFAERIRGVSLEVSERLQRRWREVGLLDEHGFSNTMDGEALG